MSEINRKLDSYREFDLVKARQSASNLQPAPHQKAALEALQRWFEAKRKAPHGGIVVLPTGGGKTFTAVRFLCGGPLSHGYKVLWLAHTHHLLDQAYGAFAPQDEAKQRERGLEVGLISETRAALHVRVVSGTPGHLAAHTIKASDDVVIATLQTMARGVQNLRALPGLKAWLKDASQLVVVFDEAHHSPAPSYRKLIEALRKSHPDLLLLGLTATPTYNDESKRGWLKKLFPQQILYQVSPKKLMLNKILAKPIFEGCETNVKPEWSEREYQKWLGTYADLPEAIISHLAQNSARNALIAQTYVDNRDKYGKTIIFAERWYQCEQIREFLKQRGIKAGAVYSHVEAAAATAKERNKRPKHANELELDAFRRGELDVLINVRMLTEGTDVPDVQSVFLTRQTTSRILLTQMVGRALRGPEFGGTERAYIVAFHDAWQQTPPFANYELENGGANDDEDAPNQRAPLRLISIELVRQLARDIGGNGLAFGPFTSLIPLGWYATTFDSHPADNDDDVETVRDLVLVFDRDQKAYQDFIAHLQPQKLPEFGGEGLTLEDVRPMLEQWHHEFFPADAPLDMPERLRSLLDIARHMAQRVGSGEETAPPFVSFDARQDHDLDQIAGAYLQQKLGAAEIHACLQQEFGRGDRLWQTIYPNYAVFKSHCDACINRQLMGEEPQKNVPAGTIKTPEKQTDREPLEDVKRQVKERDGWRCLCCGESRKSTLEIDHIVPYYSGGQNALDNLQTLCRSCNGMKSINEMNFRMHCNRARRAAPEVYSGFSLPDVADVREAAQWERYLRRELNFFYESGAVHSVTIGARGTRFYEWEVELCEGNDPQWLKPHLKALRDNIRLRIKEGRSDGCVMERLIITAPGVKSLASPQRSRR